MFTCFENVVIHYVGYEHHHPSKHIKLTHNKYEFLGIDVGKQVCDEKHYVPEHLQKLSRIELVEYLRITHEQMYQTYLLLQDFSSPQLLVYLLIDISTVTVTWYSIIVYILYNFNSPTSNCSFILNWIYVIWHGAGLYWFFKNMHEVKKIVSDF